MAGALMEAAMVRRRHFITSPGLSWEERDSLSGAWMEALVVRRGPFVTSPGLSWEERNRSSVHSRLSTVDSQLLRLSTPPRLR